MNTNPFEIIEERLKNLEGLILSLSKTTETTVKESNPEQVLNIQEASAFLNLKVPTVYSKVSRGELPVMKRGKRLYFSTTELIEYLKGGRKRSHAEIDAQAESYLNSKR